MKIVRKAFAIGSWLILLTGVGHTVGLLTSKPGTAESMVRSAMSGVHPMDRAPDRSMLDFYIANSWLIGLIYFSFGLLLLMTGPSRKSSALAGGVSAISAAIAFRYLPLPPALFLAAATVAFGTAFVKPQGR